MCLVQCNAASNAESMQVLLGGGGVIYRPCAEILFGTNASVLQVASISVPINKRDHILKSLHVLRGIITVWFSFIELKSFPVFQNSNTPSQHPTRTKHTPKLQRSRPTPESLLDTPLIPVSTQHVGCPWTPEAVWYTHSLPSPGYEEFPPTPPPHSPGGVVVVGEGGRAVDAALKFPPNVVSDAGV